MYSMMSALTLIGCLSAERSAGANSKSVAMRSDLVLAGAIAAIALCHGASVIPCSAVGLYWLLRLLPFQKVHLKRFLTVTGLCLLVLGPVLLNSSFRSIGHGAPFSVEVLVRLISGWLWSDAQTSPILGYFAVSVVAASVAQALLRDARSRCIALAFVLYPLVVGALLSTFLRPMWLDRSFAFIAPSICLLLAHSLVDVWRTIFKRLPREVDLVVVYAAVFAIILHHQLGQVNVERKMGYRELAAYVREQVPRNAILYAPENTSFWGVARYLAGPDWGSLLEVQDPKKPDESEQWQKIYARLGDKWLDRLGLSPSTRSIQVDTREFIVGFSEDARIRDASEFWMVSSFKFKPTDLPVCAVHDWETIPFRGIQLFHVTCQAGHRPLEGAAAQKG